MLSCGKLIWRITQILVGMVWQRIYHLSCNEKAVFDSSLAVEPSVPVGGFIRRCNTDHTKLLQLFWGAHYCETDWFFAPTDKQVNEWLTNSLIWGYSHNGMLLATLMLRRISENPWTTMSVDCICIHRQARGMGLTTMMIENVIYQASRLGWLSAGKGFTILGTREIHYDSLLSGLVPSLRVDSYVWCEGISAPLSKGLSHLTVDFGLKGNENHVILFNTWRQTFPGDKEQWEVCYANIRSPTKELMDVFYTKLPSNIQVWISSMYVDSSLFTVTSETWKKSESKIALECWGRPVPMARLPYTHF
jgi:hypothetical protein